jgi:hypothetical protein
MKFSYSLLGFALAATLAQATPQADASNHILLITSPELAPAWKEFADWKTRSGKPTTIVTTADLDPGNKDQDIQEKIRQRIQTGITKESVRWVILGGDSLPGGKGHVPDRDTVHETMWGKNTAIPTDIFYLSKLNWDADGDGIYGEWEEDRSAIDYPDGTIGLGRIPVRTPADVAAYTAKVIAYESRYPAKEFASLMTYTCTVPQAFPKIKTGWKDVISQAWPSGSAQWFLTNQVALKDKTPADYPLSPENWLTLINSKSSSKMHMHGHGLLHCWVLDQHKLLDAPQLSKLNNKNAYPAITTVSCFTGQFDSKKDPSIAENILRLPEAGAILVVCPSREGKPHFRNPKVDFPLMMSEGKRDGTTGTMANFWKEALGPDHKSSGTALASVKAAMVPDAKADPSFHLCLCELNLLGDPTLDLRATNPLTPKATLPDALKQGKQSLTIKTNTPGATLCLWKGSEVYHTMTIPASGLCKTSISPRTPGKLLVTIAGTGLNTFVGEVVVR